MAPVPAINPNRPPKGLELVKTLKSLVCHPRPPGEAQAAFLPGSSPKALPSAFRAKQTERSSSEFSWTSQEQRLQGVQTMRTLTQQQASKVVGAGLITGTLAALSPIRVNLDIPKSPKDDGSVLIRTWFGGWKIKL
jgi:hypothetical protein